MDLNSQKSVSTKNNILMNMHELIKKFSEENDPCSKTRELHSFVKSLSLHVEGKEDGETTEFFKFISKVPELFEELICNCDADCINDAKNKIEKQEKNKLQSLILCLEIIQMCLKCIKTEEQRLLLLQTSLTILYKSYSHCKECETIYGELLEEFKEQLASFFNTLQDVQSVMLLEFNELLKKKLHSDQFQLIISISADLYKLCDLVFNLDPAIAIALYKTLIELFENYKEIGQLDLQIDPILSALITETLNVINEFKLFLKRKEQFHVSENRIFLFKLNLIRKIVSLFPSCISANLQCITCLALDLYTLLISCYHTAQENGPAPLQNILTNTIIPMLSLFSTETAFLSFVLLHLKEISSDQQMAHLLLKLVVISIMHQKQDQIGMPERTEVFQNIFLLLQKNNPTDDMMLVSIKIPFSLFNQGKNLLVFHHSPEVESVPLYQHAYIHLAEYCKKISDSDFEKLESFVIDILNSTSTSNLVFLLISDVWMHCLRLSSIENLLVRCMGFSQRCLKMPVSSSTKLLLKRMIKFLPPNYKEKLFKQDLQLEPFLYAEHKVLCRYGAPQCNNDSQDKETDIKSKISFLFNELKESDFYNNQKLIAKACSILELCAISVNALDIQEFLRFSKVRSSLAMLYNETLRSKNYIVRMEALSLFYIMAQFTDIRITQETIAKFPDLFPSIKEYVSEVPQTGFLSEKDKFEYFEKQLHFAKNKTKSTFTLSNESKSILSLLQST
ncbi:uncharacterized protein NPIL_299441 [Nephila pilipes]|uniref:Uncharacterized protein n=1 Tax=Nephila pilipes TaxID=299642 RepID=A0A8X6MUA1_NEPPI|nr:uncharacterized protein NPIL_299441 [Nephila pilipes]